MTLRLTWPTPPVSVITFQGTVPDEIAHETISGIDIVPQPASSPFWCGMYLEMTHFDLNIDSALIRYPDDGQTHSSFEMLWQSK
jgi:hypothetical protein